MKFANLSARYQNDEYEQFWLLIPCRSPLNFGPFSCCRIGRTKSRFWIHYIFDGMCLDTFLIVRRIDFVVFVDFVLFLGAFDTFAGVSQLKTASCPGRGFYGVCLHPAARCAQAHVFVAPFPRAKFRLRRGEPSSPSSLRLWRWNSLRVVKAITAAEAVLSQGHR